MKEKGVLPQTSPTLSPKSGDKPSAETASEESIPTLPFTNPQALTGLLESLSKTTESQQEALIQGAEALTNFLDRLTSSFHSWVGLIKQPAPELEELQAALEALRTASALAGEKQRDSLSGHPSYLKELWITFITLFTRELEVTLEMAITVEKRRVRVWWPGRQNAAEFADTSVAPGKFLESMNAVLGLRTYAGLPLEEDDPDYIPGLPSDRLDGSYLECLFVSFEV